VQAAHLANRYGDDEDFSIEICKIPALAFLPLDEIPNAFNELKDNIDISEEANSIIEWFEENYIHRKVKRVSKNRHVTWRTPLFPPSLWSVYENNEYDFPRTNNSVKAWHRRWATLIGKKDLNIFKFIQEIQKEQHRV
ncbi:2668_t:CDS:1, partial [Dentiscutata heterogama]